MHLKSNLYVLSQFIFKCIASPGKLCYLPHRKPKTTYMYELAKNYNLFVPLPLPLSLLPLAKYLGTAKSKDNINTVIRSADEVIPRAGVRVCWKMSGAWNLLMKRPRKKKLPRISPTTRSGHTGIYTNIATDTNTHILAHFNGIGGVCDRRFSGFLATWATFYWNIWWNCGIKSFEFSE